MDITKFNEKFNRVDGKIYVVEEVVTPVDGVYEAELIHDNVELKTINVYTGPKLTGNKINTISFSTPSLTPWKTVIKIFSTEPQLYISYETTGDQAEAEDINNLQNAVNKTQESLNNEVNRATNAEKVLTDNLATEVTRAKNSEKTISDNVANEITRAKASEKVLTDNLNTEINRAKGSEKTISDNLSSEVNRAKVKENSIESNFNNYKTSNDSEIQGLKAKDIDLDNKKANLDYVNLELNKRYTKDQTFTREEVLKKIQDLIGTAPDTLDTFKEIADALGNDPNFATTIMNELSSKVDKVTGKSLSTNDYDNTEKSKLSDVNAKKHEHSNKSIIDKITQGLLDAWNTVSDKANKTDIPSKLSQLTNDKKFITQDDIDTSQNHIHNNKSVLDKISQKTLDDINLSVDKVLKNKLTPIETDSTLTKLDNCIGEYVHNMQIKGKTLQNLWNNENVVNFKNDTMLIQTISTNDFRINMLKDNIEYSIVNLSNKKTSADITTKNSNAYVKTLGIEPHSIQKFTISNQYISSFYGRISEGWTNTDSDKDIFKKACMILEGDWTNKEIPSFFEGIKSVGEAEGNKISILSHGKNLFDGKLEIGTISPESGLNQNDVNFMRSKNFIKIVKNTNYVLSNNKNYNGQKIFFYDVNKNFISYSENSNFIAPVNCYYLRFRESMNNIDLSTKYQLEKSTTSTTYEDYKEDKTEILTGNEPLRGLPSGIADVVNYDKNEITRNVGKVIFDANSEVSIFKTNTDIDSNFGRFFSIKVPNCLKGTTQIICDKLPNVDNSIANLWINAVEGIYQSGDGDICLRIKKERLETQDVAGFKKWLQANPVTVYYQLANPVIERLTIKDTLQTFTDGYIQIDNAITPCTQLEYSTNLPSALSGVVEIQDKILDRVNILEKKKSITWDELEGV
ncbi:hypothetical protein FDB39_05835 [Clostridium botulinum]|nr:hypothetical protein [Clostridium botulinum]